MSHEISINIRGKAAMAYVNDTPWHGLGQQLTPGAKIETWVKEAGMDYRIQDTPVMFRNHTGHLIAHAGRKVLFRSDTGDALGVVGSKYRVVQPGEVLEFFRDLTEKGGFELETAGVLFNGAKYWALARTGHKANIGGPKSKDRMDGYLLLATACDGTLQTTAQFTSVRVVCHNTLSASINSSDRLGAVKVSHRSDFDAAEVKQALGLQVWDQFIDRAQHLAEVPVSDEKAMEFIIGLTETERKEKTLEAEIGRARETATIYQLFKGKGRGADMKSAKGTAWGLVNAVTEYVDHMAGKDANNRLRLAWFYDGAYLKQKAFDMAQKIAA
jgi:phage/plasmid-like protein (TIGR03299 family)